MKTYSVVFAPEAEDNLAELYEYIAEHGPGLRITNYKGSAVIAFAVDESTDTVAILGVYYGGRDYESALGDDDDVE